MMRGIRAAGFAIAVLLLLSARQAAAEPMFLSRQYNRCATCHYSETGGGLLTPYGRSLSATDLSTTGDRTPKDESEKGEETFLYGALKDALGPLHLGLDVRPAHLHFAVPGFEFGRKLLMNADLLAAYRVNDWTVYGEVGRKPEALGGNIYSYEYWVALKPEKGLGFRAGRFMPAYGIRLADHTAYNRSYLGLDNYDQVLGLEVSQASERTLVQVSVSPGTADSVINDTGRRAFTATGRVQYDLGPRTSVVASGLFRHASTLAARSGATGVAFGFAPAARLNTWTSIDARFQAGSRSGASYIVINETSFEAVRGVWLKFSPQARTDPAAPGGGLLRALFEVDVLPRTHWNIDVSYYRDRNRRFGVTTTTTLAQLHLYL